MKALVTGGAGFIGSNVVDGLLAAGHEVAVLDDLSTGTRDNLPAEATLHEADVADVAAVAAVFAEERPEVVFHLAAHIDVRVSVEDPLRDSAINVGGTINVLRAALEHGARRVVLSSTGGAIYGETELIPTREDAPIRPLAPYGQSKFSAEGYCALFTRLHGLSTISLRYANVYGPRQDPLGEGGVVAIFCGCLSSGATPRIFGDGLQTRDYVFVGDVVRANLLAAASDATEPVNIGSGVETTVLQLADELRALGDGERPFEPLHEPARAGEVLRSALDATRAGELLGWRAEVGLAEGLRTTLAHVAAGAR
ncbi:NAD-dependent epimerase/dehydratase family protein [Conexibacter sp. JD483]|uniref:NAD-dependent epimerase/dehydratase family protein n=1 Tax=unclassified Conexibacter TaxID=2627773 RepID=UPI002720F1F2|nr:MULTISPECIES: NAD-dependent epimerase/dehydratase family protein [unclassified Conexibacter]MDO8184225.1 NAD-dependent epimerase/dehydratase family protein [Conexibacter sp. CPCC 205706]MDO8197217.1 NAD-dependent epimerase/dehydratase family protein [Conexibacter sp. CPCC 205762]MDR9367468.1 NAD-dependent epimerase/dehydratase family protein [Conexibacter sp. JD483]